MTTLDKSNKKWQKKIGTHKVFRSVKRALALNATKSNSTNNELGQEQVN